MNSLVRVAAVMTAVNFLMPDTAAPAASPAATVSPTYYFNNVESTNLGWVFEVTSTIDVTGLGYYDYTADPAPNLYCCTPDTRTSGGLLDNHMVGIFNSSGALLTSATVPAGDAGTLIAGFRYVSVPSYTLTPGLYVIDGTQQGTAGANPTDPAVFEFSSFATILSIVDLGGVYTTAGSPGVLTFPGATYNTYLAYIWGLIFLWARARPSLRPGR